MKKYLPIIALMLGGALCVYAWFLSPLSFTTARVAAGKMNVIKVGERRVAYYARGKGPRVILAASLAREASDFNELVMALNAAGYRTVCVEAPGIGATDLLPKPTSLYTIAKDVKAAADDDVAQTGSETTIALVGHAFGNRVVRATAARYPRLAKGVILLAAGGQRPIEPMARRELRNSAMPYLTSSRRERAVKYAFFAQGNAVPDYWMRGWHLRTGLLQASTLKGTQDKRWQGAGGLPILIVQALEDTIAPKADAADLLKKRLGAQLQVVLVAKAGHALLPEQPERVARAIIDFLQSPRLR